MTRIPRSRGLLNICLDCSARFGDNVMIYTLCHSWATKLSNTKRILEISLVVVEFI